MAQEFAPGQVWSYEGAKLETSRVIIGKIDRFDGQKKAIISILITDASIPAEDPTPQTIWHTPVEEESLRKSLIVLQGKTSVPAEFMDGYGQWRQAFDQGKAGYFTIPVDKIVEYIGQVLSQPSAPQ